MAPGGNPNKPWEDMKLAAARARLPYDRDMLLNLAFFLGHQFVEWDSDIRSLRNMATPPSMSHTPRTVINKIFHFVMKEHSDVLVNQPMLDVFPATTDPGDISIAEIARAYLKYITDTTVCDFESELSDAVQWALIAGEGYLKWTFDPKAKRPDIMSVSPLDIYVDPFATSFKRARYVIHSQFMDIQAIYDLYGVEVQPTKLDKGDLARAALMRDMGQAPVLEGATVNEIWLAPGVARDREDGMLAIWTGKTQLLEPSSFPYSHGHLPYTQLTSVPLMKTPHGTSAVTFLRDPQIELNVYHQQRFKVRRSWANPKWWIPDELEMETEPDDTPAQVLRGNSQGGAIQPSIIQPTVFPETRDGEYIAGEMQDVVGQHEVSQAQVPGRVEAARAIELLKEADDSRLAQLSRSIRLAASEGGWQVLMLARQFIPGETMAQTYSAEGMPEVRRFKTANFKPGMRVVTTMDTGLTRSRAARMDAALNLWEKGVIQDPETMAQLLELPVGTISPQRDYDLRLARNETMTMAEGTPVTPNSWDAHAIHLREHNNFRKTAEYLALPSKTKQMFEMHCQLHEQLELKELSKEAEKTAVIQGILQPPVPEGEPPNEAGVPEDQPLQPVPETAQPTAV